MNARKAAARRARRAASHLAKTPEGDVVKSLEEAVELDESFSSALSHATLASRELHMVRADLRERGIPAPDPEPTHVRRKRLTMRDRHDAYVRCPACQHLAWLRDCQVVDGEAQRTLYDVHGPKTRRCGKCGQPRPLGEFWTSTRYGYQAWCKACCKAAGTAGARRRRNGRNKSTQADT